MPEVNGQKLDHKKHHKPKLHQHAHHHDVPDHLKINKPGAWLPVDHRVHRECLQRVADHVDKHPPKELSPAVAELKEFIEKTPRVYMYFTQMFDEVPRKHPYFQDRAGHKQIRDYKHMLRLLNHFVTMAPEWTAFAEATGVVGVPIWAMLDYPMGTASGHAAFLDPDVNRKFKKVLCQWGKYLQTPESAKVLDNHAEGWFGEASLNDLVQIANAPYGTYWKFEEMYICDPKAKYYGYKSWDDFFTRPLRDGVRPLADPKDDDVIAGACESRPYNLVRNLKMRDKFFIKGQRYSPSDILAHDPLAEHFAGGTLYQAFLSPLSYHRWHAPVGGVVRHAFVEDGTYYSEPLSMGLGDASVHEIDRDGIINSQAYLTSLATRGIIIIEADSKNIGLVAFVAIGMGEVSSCEITIKEGQRVGKGDELGMFHFGGSSHCLLFPGGVDLEGWPAMDREANMPVRGELARVKKA